VAVPGTLLCMVTLAALDSRCMAALEVADRTLIVGTKTSGRIYSLQKLIQHSSSICQCRDTGRSRACQTSTVKISSIYTIKSSALDYVE
jgi:hypothetical protein